jgi:hypothetical protein
MATIVYSQKAHKFTFEGRDYGGDAHTYSGRHGAKNSPAAQCFSNTGPIPRGTYLIERMEFSHPRLGGHVIPLKPWFVPAMCGRDRFYIHGDSFAHPGDASEGCIVTTLAIRQMINNHHINTLEVVQ